MSNNPWQVMEMMEAGANGYVIKDADKVEIIAAIEAVYEGSTFFCRDTNEKLAKAKAQIERGQVRKSQKPKFSDKEITIIKMICAQDSNKQIAGKMGLSTCLIPLLI